jgi:hypothetical protein
MESLVKTKPAKRAIAKTPRNKAHTTPTSQLNRQSRKVMGQHYRAKYGVK